MKKSIAQFFSLSTISITFVDYFWNFQLVSMEIYILLLVIFLISGSYLLLFSRYDEFQNLKKSSSDIYKYKTTSIDWVNLILGFGFLIQTALPRGERMLYFLATVSLLYFSVAIFHFIFKKSEKYYHFLVLTDTKIIIFKNQKTDIDLEKVDTYLIVGEKIKILTNSWGSRTIDTTKIENSAGLIHQIVMRIEALKKKSTYPTPIPPK